MKSVRIGAGLGFYGDSWQAVRASIERARRVEIEAPVDLPPLNSK
ncbi:MAG: hypothetical protein OEO84_15985 [Betaproteobacteria bacterium]|nr:hypothetical protein [Betaproteobacteria bacterium]